MKHCNVSEHRITRRVVPVACAIALAAASTMPLSHAAHAGEIVVPPLPPGLVVDAGHHPFLLGKAQGTQNYICLPAGVDAAGNPAFAWKLFTPEATLFSSDPDDPKQLITHFFSPNPDEINTDPFTDF